MLLREIGCTLALPLPIKMGNQAAISQIASEASSQRSKHIDIKYKFLKDLYLKQILDPVHVSTKSMLADLLTKALPTFVVCPAWSDSKTREMKKILTGAECWNNVSVILFKCTVLGTVSYLIAYSPTLHIYMFSSYMFCQISSYSVFWDLMQQECRYEIYIYTDIRYRYKMHVVHD